MSQPIPRAGASCETRDQVLNISRILIEVDGLDQVSFFLGHFACRFRAGFVIVTHQMEYTVDQEFEKATLRIDAGRKPFSFSRFIGYDDIAEEMG